MRKLKLSLLAFFCTTPLWAGYVSYPPASSTPSGGGSSTVWNGASTLATTLTGFVSTAGVVNSADTVLSALENLDGNIALKENTANKTDDPGLIADSSVLFPTQHAVKSYADGVSAFAAAGLALKENVANKDTDVTLVTNSDVRYASQRAIKTYVDNNITGVSTFASAGLLLKENTITAGLASQYWRGDKTFQTLDTLAVPENTNLYFTNARARLALSVDGAPDPLAYNNITGGFSMPAATSVQSGYLTAGDHAAFSAAAAGIVGVIEFKIWGGLNAPATNFGEPHYWAQALTLSSVKMSAFNCGAVGSIDIAVQQWRAGVLIDTATGSLAATGGMCGASVALNHSQTMLVGDITTIDLTAIPTGTPESLTVAVDGGSVAGVIGPAGTFEVSVLTKVANYGMGVIDNVINADAAAGNISITLPSAAASFVAGKSKLYTIKKIDGSANTVTVLPFGAESIEFGASLSLPAQGLSATLYTDGTNFYVQ